MKREAEKEIIKTIGELSGSYTPYVIFTDWVKMTAIAIQNSCCALHDKTWQTREKAYIDTAKKYSNQERASLCKMQALLWQSFQEVRLRL